MFMKPSLICAICLGAVAAVPLCAQSITYTDPAAFTNAANALLSYDLKAATFPFDQFFDLRYGGGYDGEQDVGPSVTLAGIPPGGGREQAFLPGITFRGDDLIADSGPQFTLTGPILRNFDAGHPLVMDFESPVYAFGANFSSGLAPGSNFFTATLTLDTGESFSLTAAGSPNSTFFGFVSPTPVRQLVFSDGGVYPAGPADPSVFFHEESIGSIFMIEQVPEPSRFALFGVGAFALLWCARRKKRATTAGP